MEKVSKKVILDTLASSEEYSRQLDVLLQSVSDAETQVQQSASSAIKQVESTFSNLEDRILKALNARKVALLSSVRSYESDSALPLRQCRNNILAKQSANNEFLITIRNILKSGGFQSDKVCNDFNDKSSLLGALPAVPDLELVPNITFKSDTADYGKQITSLIGSIGSVSRIGPVQISSIEPHPGSLLVKWEEIDIESQVDILAYNLQIAFTNINSTTALSAEYNTFHNVYDGPEHEFLVRDLRPNQTYSFRVCGRINSDSEWSSWSMIKKGVTRKPSFTWDTSNSSYTLSNEDKLATVVKTGSILYSSDKLISKGNAIQFTLLSSCPTSDDDGIGLTTSNQLTSQTLMQPGAIFVGFCGNIYMDGKQKLIRFPKMERNSKITFSCERLQNKWRINIENEFAAVIYDWSTASEKLYFAMISYSADVQVLVE